MDKLARFEIVMTFRVPTFAVESDSEFKFEIEETFNTLTFACEASRVVTSRDVVLDIPDTLSEVRVPTDVMLGCEACETTVAKKACETVPVTFAPLILSIPDPSEIIASPLTLRLVRVPTEVMFGCEACETTVAKNARETVPVTFEPLIFDIPDPFEIIALPFTVRLVSVPTEVILGCEACETTRAKVDLATFP